MSALSPTSASSMSAEPSANAQSSAQQLAVGAVDGIDNSLTANSAEHDAAKDEKINHTSSNDFTSMPPPAPPALKPTKNNAVKGSFIDSEQTADTDFSSVPPFSWELYLAELNAAPVALQAFTHVGRAFRELVPKGNVVEVVWHREAINNDVNLPLEAATSGEVANISASQQEHVYFWYARVIISSAPLLLVNWLGSSENDVCSEFWVDCEEGNVHSVGWCGEFFQLTQQQPQHSVISDTHGLPRRYVCGKPAPKIINVNPISPTEESDAAAPTASDTVAAPAEPGPIIPPHTKYEMRMPPTVLSNLQAANSSGQPADTSKMIDNYRAEAWAAKTPNPEDIEEFYGIPPAERIVPGNYVDLLSEEEPTCAWPVKILDSAGGRLKLHYWPVGDERIEKQWPALRDGKTPQQFVEECEEDEFWVFCNSYLIRPLGSTGRYRIPDDLPECYRDLLRNLEGTWHAGLKELVERENQHKLPGDIFSYFEPDKNHTFQAGMRLESLNPINEKHIQPAYIGRVFDNGYVHLVYDDMEKYEWVEEDARERQRALRAGTATCKKCNKPMKAGECDASCAAMNARSDAIQKEMQAAGVCPSPPATRAPPGCSRQFGIDDTLEPVSPSVRGPPLHSSVTKASLRILTFQNSTRMLPPYWSERNGVKLSKPSKWSTTRHGEFSWPRMIDGFGGQLAPRGSFKFVEQLITNPGFSVGSKLEAVNPEAPDEICTATIVRVIPPMLWIHIDSYGQSLTYMTPFDSTDIFPCGFCSMHNVKLHLPRIMLHGRRSAFVRSVSNANLQTATVPASAGPSGKNDGSLSEIDMRVRKSEIGEFLVFDEKQV